jgi:hypothetical protein
MRKLKTLIQRIEEEQEPQKAINNTIRSHEKQHTNVRKRITRIIEQEHSYFITFTLNDKHLHKKQRTHIKKITEALAKVSVIDYTLNNDYGDKTNRLHYHAVACFNYQLDYTIIQKIYQYGTLDIKKIINKDIKSLSEYIQKLKNHALKKSVYMLTYKRLPKYPINHTLKELLYETRSTSPNC